MYTRHAFIVELDISLVQFIYINAKYILNGHSRGQKLYTKNIRLQNSKELVSLDKRVRYLWVTKKNIPLINFFSLGEHI